MADVLLNFKITGDGKDGAAAVSEVVTALKKMGVEATNTGKKVKDSGSNFNKFADDAKGSLRNLVGNALGAIGVGQFLALGAAAINLADDLGDMSKVTGVSTETLSIMGLAAEQTGVEMTAVAGTFKKLSANLAAVQEGNVGVAQSFAAIGLDAKKLIGVPLEESFLAIVNALDQYEDGANKNAIVQQVLGSKATGLIPLMDALAGDGFANLTTEAERLGRVVREDTVRAAELMERTMISLKSQVVAVSRSFFEGFLPGLDQAVSAVDQMTGSTEGMRDVFGGLGTGVGFVLKGIVFVLNEVATQANNFIFLIVRASQGGVQAIKALAKGNLAAARQAIKDSNADIQAFADAGKEDAGKLWTTLFGTPAVVKEAAGPTRDAAILAFASVVDQLRKKGEDIEAIDLSGLATVEIEARTKAMGERLKKTIVLQAADLSAVLKAQSDTRLASLDNELALIRERTTAVVAQATATYAQGESSMAEFFKARSDAIEEQGRAELASAEARVAELRSALQFQLDSGAIRKGGAEELTMRKDIATAESAIQITGLQLQAKRIALVNEEAVAREELNDTMSAFEVALAEAQGRAHEAALVNIEKQAEEFTKEMRQAGLTAEEIQTKIAAFKETATTTANIAEMQRRAELLSTAIEQNQTRLNNLVTAGTITQNAATVAQNQFVEAQQGAAQSLIDAFISLRTGVSDPAVIAALDAMILKLQGVQAQAGAAQSQLELMGSRVLAAGGTALLGFLDAATSKSFTFRDAFRTMALDIIKAIGDIAKQWLVLKAVQGIASATGLPVPEGFAKGGPVPGRGNKDTVPAMLTPGEYVLTPKMVAHMGGTNRLEAFRRMMRGGVSLRRNGVSYFEHGGPVMGTGNTGSAAVASEHRVVLDVSPDLVIRTIEGSAGGRAVVRAARKNRNGMNDALGNR